MQRASWVQIHYIQKYSSTQTDSSQKRRDRKDLLLVWVFCTCWTVKTRLCHDATVNCWKLYNSGVMDMWITAVLSSRLTGLLCSHRVIPCWLRLLRSPVTSTLSLCVCVCPLYDIIQSVKSDSCMDNPLLRSLLHEMWLTRCPAWPQKEKAFWLVFNQSQTNSQPKHNDYSCLICSWSFACQQNSSDPPSQELQDVIRTFFMSRKLQGCTTLDKTCSSTPPNILVSVCGLSVLRLLPAGTHHCWPCKSCGFGPSCLAKSIWPLSKKLGLVSQC